MEAEIEYEWKGFPGQTMGLATYRIGWTTYVLRIPDAGTAGLVADIIKHVREQAWNDGYAALKNRITELL